MAEVNNDLVTDDRGAQADHDLVAQPHQQNGPVAEAETAAAEMSSNEQPLGRLGRRFDRRSPFFVGMTAAGGVAVTYGAVRLLESMSPVLVLIGVAFFLALGLEPAASWVVNHKLPRWAATTLVFVIFLALLGAFVGAAIPPLVQQAGELIHQAPHYIQQAQDLLVPKIIGRAVKVPALITVVAVLIGGALLGIVGALVAIPVAAALQLLTQEILFPRLDNV